MDSRDRLKIWVKLAAACVPLASVALACGGDDLTCGAGTREQDGQCVAAVSSGGASGSGGTGATGGASGSGGSAGDSGAAVTPPDFAGITSAAPASDVAIQVTWAPATDALTAQSDIVYKVYSATAAGEQNFGTPTLVSPPGATSLLVGNLQPGTKYYFVVRASDEDGNEDTNSKELDSAAEIDDQPPTFAGAKSSKTIGATSVELSWDEASDDKTSSAGIAYTITWSTSASGAPTGTLGKLTDPGVTSAVVDNLPDPEATYFFTVRARDAAGNTDDNVEAIEGTTDVDVTPPVFTGCDAVGQPGATNATLSWKPADDDTTLPDDMGYNVYAFTDPVDADTPFGNPVGSFTGGTSGQVQGLKPDTTYYFVCRALDATGNEDENIVFRTTTTLLDGTPPVFGGLVTVVADSTTAELSWNAATDDQTPQEQIVYLVYQGTSPGSAVSGPAVAQSNPGTTVVTLTGLSSSTAYYWVVRAQDKALNVDENTTEISKTTLVSFALDVQTIFSSFCVKAGCHGADNPPQGMNLDVGSAYDALVNTSALEVPALKRVLPGEPDNSYMYMKITGAPGILLSKMPPGGNQQPTQEMIATIRQWILEGAKNN
jgi:hypothetical protein